MQKFVGARRRYAQRAGDKLRIEKQRQLVKIFDARCVQSLFLPPSNFINFREKTCVSEASLLKLTQLQSVFSETRRAVRLLQQPGGFFLFLLPSSIPVPALRPFVDAHGVGFASVRWLLLQRRGILLRRVSSLEMGVKFSRCRATFR